jgi:hypothetical protein
MLRCPAHTSSSGEIMQRRCTKQRIDPSGVHYLSCSGALYLSLNYHRGSGKGRRGKSIWAIGRDAECHTFCEAEIGKWSDARANYWAVSVDARVQLGKNGERLAFFDAPVNVTDPWHGYPISGRPGSPTRRRPPDELVGRWLDEGRISYVTYDRILTGRL